MRCHRRVADAQQKFGSASSEMARTYIMYGSVRAEGDAQPGTPSQIWRYNYVPGFHSSAELESPATEVTTPPGEEHRLSAPAGDYTGIPAEANSLATHCGAKIRVADNLPPQQQAPARILHPPYVHGRLSGRRIFQTDRAARYRYRAQSIFLLKSKRVQPRASRITSSEPSATLSRSMDDFTVGHVRNRVHARAGSYVCKVLVREASTGRIFTEAINFDVK